MKKKMRWMQGVLLGVMICSAATVQGVAQSTNAVKDDLFEGTKIFEKGASNVTEISMDPNSLGMVGGKARNMVLNVVHSYEYDQPGLYRMEDVDVFRNKVNTGDWFCSVHTRDLKNHESTDICYKRRKDDLEEKAIITVGPKELTFIHTIRKGNSGEQGEMGGFMPWLSLNGMPQMAMIDPDLLALQIRAQMPDMAVIQSSVDAAMKSLPTLKIDSAGLEKQLREVEKQMKNMPQLQLKLDDTDKGAAPKNEE